jgi:hypothetical protein
MWHESMPVHSVVPYVLLGSDVLLYVVRVTRGICIVLIIQIISMARLGAQDTQIPRVNDRVFENIVVGGQRLTNAVVFSKTATHVMLSHAEGLTGMRIEDLDAATLRLLGYAVEDDDTGAGGPSGWRPLDGFLSMLSDAFDLNENRWYSMAGIVIFEALDLNQSE